MQAASEAEARCGQEIQQVEQQMAAIDEELAKQGATQAPTSKLAASLFVFIFAHAAAIVANDAVLRKL